MSYEMTMDAEAVLAELDSRSTITATQAADAAGLESPT